MISFLLCLYKTIRKVVTDLYATLSNNKSFLSSKRVERMLLFSAALGICLCYVWYNRSDITTAEIVTITTLLFGYAGFNTIMGNKDKTIAAATAQTDKIIEEKIDDKVIVNPHPTNQKQPAAPDAAP